MWKGIIKGTTMYLDSERNPTIDYLIRSLRKGTPLEPRDSKQNGVKKIMLNMNISPITRGEILDELNIAEDSKRIMPLMYYYNWSKDDLKSVKAWKKKYLYSDIDWDFI